MSKRAKERRESDTTPTITNTPSLSQRHIRVARLFHKLGGKEGAGSGGHFPTFSTSRNRTSVNDVTVEMGEMGSRKGSSGALGLLAFAAVSNNNNNSSNGSSSSHSGVTTPLLKPLKANGTDNFV